jgi:hypothetical protein
LLQYAGGESSLFSECQAPALVFSVPRDHAGGCSLIILFCFDSATLLLDSSTIRLFFPLRRTLPFGIALSCSEVQVRQLPRPHLPSHVRYRVYSVLLIQVRLRVFSVFTHLPPAAPLGHKEFEGCDPRNPRILCFSVRRWPVPHQKSPVYNFVFIGSKLA